MVKVNVYGIDGSSKDRVDLPEIFNTPYRPDLIRKSFNALHSNKRQAYGADYLAGTKHATASVGKGRGMSRVPRLTQGNRAALAPCVVGGRRAHPPKVERNWKEKMNKKENKLAKNSAIAATANKEIVTKRGHEFNEKLTLPLIVDDEFETIKKTKEVISALEKIGVYDDILRAENGKHIRAGRGKMRGRKYKTPKSLLIVTSEDNVLKSSRNLTGVDVVRPSQINIEHIAPGGDAGRLTIFTKSALKEIGGAK
ncbi:MAG TPA: 50S ribosomal protein L4 [Bacteroidetes bacterium]|nr:50S ribosomal protein L4 [Bacteroidota bacterium]